MCSLIILSLKDKNALKIEINAFFDFLSQCDGFMRILSQCDALCHNVTSGFGFVLQFQKFVSTLQQTHSNKIAQSGGGGRCASRPWA